MGKIACLFFCFSLFRCRHTRLRCGSSIRMCFTFFSLFVVDSSFVCFGVDSTAIAQYLFTSVESYSESSRDETFLKLLSRGLVKFVWCLNSSVSSSFVICSTTCCALFRVNNNTSNIRTRRLLLFWFSWSFLRRSRAKASLSLAILSRECFPRPNIINNNLRKSLQSSSVVDYANIEETKSA